MIRGKIVEKVHLERRRGRSDSTYLISIEDIGQGQYVVNIEYGRGGRRLTQVSKTRTPVSIDVARRIAAQLEATKLRDMYQMVGRRGPSRGSVSHATAHTAQLDPPVSAVAQAPIAPVHRPTGIIPQISVSIRESAYKKLLAGDGFYMHEVIDGDRLVVAAYNGAILASNAKGEGTTVPAHVLDQLDLLTEFGSNHEGLCVEGVYVEPILWLSEMHMVEGSSLTLTSYSRRVEHMDAIASWFSKERAVAGFPGHAGIEFLPVARTPAEKAALATELVSRAAHAVVFKDASSPIRPGRRSKEQRQFVLNRLILCEVRPATSNGLECIMYDENREPVTIGLCLAGVTHQVYTTASMARAQGTPIAARVRLQTIKDPSDSGLAFVDFKPDADPEIECLLHPRIAQANASARESNHRDAQNRN
jgi:hypothetical protein